MFSPKTNPNKLCDCDTAENEIGYFKRKKV